MYFVHNLETNKLNIFTGGKQHWMALPADKREEIKRACLWSRSIDGWVSRGMVPSWNVMHLKDVLVAAGFEDRGTEGEKRTFAEQVEAKQERAEARAERMEDRAGKAEDTSKSLLKHAHQMADCIPMGQPILVGHYSEKRDRNFRERIHNTFRKGIDEADKAKHYAHRAQLARETAEGAQYSNPGYLDRSIKECRTEMAVLNNRLLGKFYHDSEPKAISDEDRARYNELLAEQQDKLDFFLTCLATCGKVVYSKETLKDKTAVKVHGRWEPIVKLNATTVATPNICFPDPAHQKKYALKYRYAEIQDAK